MLLKIWREVDHCLPRILNMYTTSKTALPAMSQAHDLDGECSKGFQLGNSETKLQVCAVHSTADVHK